MILSLSHLRVKKLVRLVDNLGVKLESVLLLTHIDGLAEQSRKEIIIYHELTQIVDAALLIP